MFGSSELVRDNIILKMSRGPGKGQGVDMNMEHNIGKIKELFARKGIYGGWDRLANISAAIDVLDSIQRSMAASLGASYSGTGHKNMDTSDLVWRVARKARELELNRPQVNRRGKATNDLLVAGEAALKSSTIATFNKKRRELLKGIIEVTEDDVDNLAAMDIVVNTEEEH
ncbi:hypothetical protein B0H17DRAFT_954591 [Mycena rosella]|uniref:DUF6589 domain-containing protein n=1 Tax=Mycena rosella TaxID=1033263 RepID=A0AAD7G212_MYCRO|nr:hypothetical protein B0H17DRAFT_954591 [Mycena rosella]